MQTRLLCQQVFFSDDPQRRDWKIVCCTDVRGRRGQLEVNQPMPTVIAVGNDEDFVGLQPQILESEPDRDVAAAGGTYIPASQQPPIQEDTNFEQQ